MPTTLKRPRSLVSHVKHLAGVDPLTARMFIDASGKAALKRLGIKPAVKARTRTTARHGRHLEITLVDKDTGEKVTRHVRRRRRQVVTVGRYTIDQAAAVLADTKPRKNEYKQLREDALRAVAATTDPSARRMRMLPRHTKWSKHRNKR